MSAPKKGKDLSALKARLAKKAAEAEGTDASGGVAQPADVPAPGEAAAIVPPPGEVQKPAAPAADIPAPGEVKKPMDIPAPGEVRKPVDIPAPGEVRAAPMPAEPNYGGGSPKRGDIASDPLSGGVAFDPNAGVFDDVGGDIKPRSSIGLPIFAGLVGILVGAGLGWMLHRSTEGSARVDAARKKAATIEAKVNEIEESRASIALKVGEAADALQAKEPDKAIEALGALEPTFIELGDLFGWQMAAMDPTVIKSIFDLAEANNSLQLDVGILKGWVAANSEILSERTKGPAAFVVVRSPEGGSILAEYVGAVCDEIPDLSAPPEGFKPETLKKCEGPDIIKANGYFVRMAIGGDASLILADQASFLIPDGPIYSYAIGATPEANAKSYFDIRMGRINEVLAQMVKDKDEALKGIGNYTDNPPVDGG